MLTIILTGIICFWVGYVVGNNKISKNEEIIYQFNDLFLGEVHSIFTPDIQVLGTLIGKDTIIATITAYSSTPEETDDTPFITASGQRVRSGIIANNCLVFGEMIEMDGEIYEVQDRMSKRYGCEYFDIWMENKELAINLGRQTKEITIN